MTRNCPTGPKVFFLSSMTSGASAPPSNTEGGPSSVGKQNLAFIRSIETRPSTRTFMRTSSTPPPELSVPLSRPRSLAHLSPQYHALFRRCAMKPDIIFPLKKLPVYNDVRVVKARLWLQIDHLTSLPPSSSSHHPYPHSTQSFVVMVPNNPDAYLSQIYGPSWRVPDSEHHRHGGGWCGSNSDSGTPSKRRPLPEPADDQPRPLR